MPPMQMISILVPPAELARIDRAARAVDLTRSAFIRRTLQGVLDDGEQMISLLANDHARSTILEAFTRPGVMQAVASAMGHELTHADRQRFLAFMKPVSPSKSEAAPRRSRRSK